MDAFHNRAVIADLLKYQPVFFSGFPGRSRLISPPCRPFWGSDNICLVTSSLDPDIYLHICGPDSHGGDRQVANDTARGQVGLKQAPFPAVISRCVPFPPTVWFVSVYRTAGVLPGR